MHFFKKKDFIYLFLEEKGRREGERHQCEVASHTLPAGGLACNPDMCPDWELNCDPSVRRAVLNPLSYTSQGYVVLFNDDNFFAFDNGLVLKYVNISLFIMRWILSSF